MNYDLTNYPNFTKYADDLGLVGFERKVAFFDFVVYESEDGEMSFDTFKERLEVRRASCLDADVEMIVDKEKEKVMYKKDYNFEKYQQLFSNIDELEQPDIVVKFNKIMKIYHKLFNVCNELESSLYGDDHKLIKYLLEKQHSLFLTLKKHFEDFCYTNKRELDIAYNKFNMRLEEIFSPIKNA